MYVYHTHSNNIPQESRLSLIPSRPLLRTEDVPSVRLPHIRALKWLIKYYGQAKVLIKSQDASQSLNDKCMAELYKAEL